MLPLCKPLIAVLTLLTLMGEWNDFAWPLIAARRATTCSRCRSGCSYLKGQYGTDYGALMAMAL